MDILRKELNQVYASQNLGAERLDRGELERCKALAENLVAVTDGAAVITDVSNDSSFLCTGALCRLLGLAPCDGMVCELDSSDEDVIYERLHPEDLVEKRMLEYELFKLVDALPPEEKRNYKATCTIRILDGEGRFRLIDNSTQVLRLSPAGKMWLVLCRYDVSPRKSYDEGVGIDVRILNNHTGESRALELTERRTRVLTDREKEVLTLIRDGLPSKQIADELDISIHTVNRHRQNILEKLSVGNSVEAVFAATAMRLI